MTIATRERGFTLIEMMIAVAIAAILVVVALPSYTAVVQRGHRSDARAGLLQVAQFMERWRNQTGSYAGAAVPAGLDRTPASGPTQYRLGVLVGADGASYLASAVPQAGGIMAGDACGTLTLDQSGLRGVTGSAPLDRCWSR